MSDADKADYRNTVFLPKTDFPMRGSLPVKEPELLARWKKLGMYKKLRDQAKAEGREKFVLHDGPPYANGNIHIGHALNKILKDIVVRSHQMLGFDAPFVPGWDCHGLPIEWKIEEQYREKKQDKDAIPKLQFRAECREFAEKWKNIQSVEFQRLGVSGDWENPYTTMTFAAEAQIVREIHKFLMNGLLYKGVKPVMWSVVEKTALAEAEIEYHEHKSTTIWIKFPIVKSPDKNLADGGNIVIWTTTPWTMPGNRALAFGDFEYTLVRVDEVEEGSFAKVGDKLTVAVALLEQFCKDAKIAKTTEISRPSQESLSATVCRHPWRKGAAYEGYFDYDVPLHHGDFVTTEAGTGFVHIAPGHGEDDFNLGKKHSIKFEPTVGDDGVYLPHVKGLAGKTVYKPDGKEGDANGSVIKAMIEAGCLLAKGSIRHPYPHSWRSKAPLIFRTTPQWFIALDGVPTGGNKSLRELALDAIGNTKWYPSIGENRIRGMIESRPDWCVSRQREWGVPIALFVDKKTDKPLKDPEVLERIAKAFEKEGADAWYSRDPQYFLGDKYKAADYNQVFDIIDVWFESGATHSFCLNQKLGSSVWPDLRWPADLYLEGSDQHRGWFHSSLLESCGSTGVAPYKKVLTHGFTLDEQGRKMSKSMGNVVAPQEVFEKMGADILRLWVLASDYSQ
ncbi:MAG: isoleucine--tRNA ligase, partial [Alphaproteobacteria bacterium]|nr:isoleucine--tRNA ligase [Alphaproteobacteria bacterium]